MNQATLIGRLGKAAEVRYTRNGTAVASFSVATSENWTDKQTGERHEKTEWHNIVLWGKMAETLTEYLTKGKQVMVQGRLQTDKWTDKEGTTRYSTKINANNIELLGSKSDGGGRPANAPPPAAEGAQPERNDESGSQERLPAAPPAPAEPPSADDIPF